MRPFLVAKGKYARPHFAPNKYVVCSQPRDAFLQDFLAKNVKKVNYLCPCGLKPSGERGHILKGIFFHLHHLTKDYYPIGLDLHRHTLDPARLCDPMPFIGKVVHFLIFSSRPFHLFFQFKSVLQQSFVDNVFHMFNTLFAL